MASRSYTRPKPDKILNSGKKYWENLIYVQDKKKANDWHPRHAYLAELEKVVYLLTYSKEPTLSSKNQKPKEYWALYTVVEGMAPRGFSRVDDREDDTAMSTVCLQTQDPEGVHFVGLKNKNDMKEFVAKVKEALRLPPSTAPKPRLPPRNAPPVLALPARTPGIYYDNRLQYEREEGDNASLKHLGESTSSQASVDLNYIRKESVGHVLVAHPGDLLYDSASAGPSGPQNEYERVYESDRYQQS